MGHPIAIEAIRWWRMDFGWLMPLSTIFELYCGHQFYMWKKREDPENTSDLSQVTDTFYHIHVIVSPFLGRESDTHLSDYNHLFQLPYDHGHDWPQSIWWPAHFVQEMRF